MPVVKGGQINGYVTLALDHDHIRQFSDRLMPTEERYTPIADAIKGNYAFWDHKSRSISHPRDYFIVGYDPKPACRQRRGWTTSSTPNGKSGSHRTNSWPASRHFATRT
jgi:hypothetical protein